MEAIRFDDLTFTYPLGEEPVIRDFSFSVDESEFLLLCGKSGCGKTTLLRQIKKNLIPYGERIGDVLYYGTPVEELDDRRNAAEIGFVQQNPDNQIVTDKVWHELAFGLESLGLDNQSIRRRVAEMASYFDIQEWFRKDVSSLSGGQKQLLNLASIMVMQPKLLVLDEPTSQLDPIAASEFLQTIRKINRDLGVTIILSEHRLEEVFPMADRVLVMDEGRLLACDEPGKIGSTLARQEHPMFHGLPAVTKIYHTAKAGEGKSPLTVRDGRLWIKDMAREKSLDEETAQKIWEEVRNDEETAQQRELFGPGRSEDRAETSGKSRSGHDAGDSAEPVIRIKDVWYRYSRSGSDVLRDLDLEVRRGEFYALLGGNGVGKTTSLKAVLGIIKPQRGKVETKGKLAMLPQNPQALFSEITVEDDMLEALHGMDRSDEEKAAAVSDMLRLMEIEHLRKLHPYDISGGEQQRLALGKVLLLEPEVLLLDEPTKGLDPFFKLTLAEILKELCSRGITIVMVSHDIEFCAQHVGRCAMFFDGSVVSEEEPKEFFAGNSFYTTAANRLAREFFPRAVTWEEVAECIRRIP